MAILLMGTGTRGYRTHMGRVWVRFCTHGQYPYPTHQLMGRARVQSCTHGERAWLPPYVILVINDNLYGLICALIYICSVGPLACFELHMLESRLKEEKIISKRSFVDQGQGVSP